MIGKAIKSAYSLKPALYASNSPAFLILTASNVSKRMSDASNAMRKFKYRRFVAKIFDDLSSKWILPENSRVINQIGVTLVYGFKHGLPLGFTKKNRVN